MRIQRLETSADSQVWQHIPETDVERELTFVEQELLTTILSNQIRELPALTHQITLATCTSREYTNYGAFIYLAFPPHAPRIVVPGGPVGNATIGWLTNPPGKEAVYMLNAFAFFESGLLTCMEMVPVGTNPWSPDECIALLTAPREMIWMQT
ncbi:MAG TPA: hypothetical protein VK157_16370 [Phycisphaerales bacterium]|nr:hypothetical protein [Phycisphaerales bacterium]